jgi:hypothetical protein
VQVRIEIQDLRGLVDALGDHLRVGLPELEAERHVVGDRHVR